ncbi:hypothetical protein QFZ78_001026 [Paenibacillus sp. V4I5]|nr:hypothetical protein [Paenibacillus sp. V4I5]
MGNKLCYQTVPSHWDEGLPVSNGSWQHGLRG